MRVRHFAVVAALFLSLVNPPAGADEGGLGGALQEARLVSSYYQFARHCESVGAITEGELAEFRQRLLGAVFEKYGLDVDEERQVIRVVEGDSLTIETAGLPVTPEICAGFIGSI